MGPGWGRVVEKNAENQRKFSLLLRKPERNYYITPFSLFCMAAMSIANYHLYDEPAKRMADGRVRRKLRRNHKQS